jgi:hypothetical protein
MRLRSGQPLLLIASLTLALSRPAGAQDAPPPDAPPPEAPQEPSPAEPAPPPAEPPAAPAPPPEAPPAPAPPPPEAPPAAPIAPPAPTPAPPAPTTKPKPAPSATPARAAFTPPPPTRTPEEHPEPPRTRSKAPPPNETPKRRKEPAPDPLAWKPSKQTEDSAEKDKDDTDGVFGPFRIGFLLGGGLPSLMSFGGAIKLTRYLGAGLNVGLIPKVQLDYYGEATLSYQEYDIYGRIFPTGGAFFFGAGAGYATVAGTFTNRFDVSMYQALAPGLPSPLDVTSEGSVRTLVLTPQVGMQHTFSVGFTIGIDAGAQIPIAPSETDYSTRVPASVPQPVIDQFVTPNDRKVEETLDTIGRTVIPTFNVHVGWLL